MKILSALLFVFALSLSACNDTDSAKEAEVSVDCTLSAEGVVVPQEGCEVKVK